MTHDEKFTLNISPVLFTDGKLSKQICPYDTVNLEVLAIHKDFTLSADGKIDDEFMTYPTAIVIFEDKNFIRFY